MINWSHVRFTWRTSRQQKNPFHRSSSKFRIIFIAVLFVVPQDFSCCSTRFWIVSSKEKRLLLSLSTLFVKLGLLALLWKLLFLGLSCLLDVGNLVAELLLQRSHITSLPLTVLLSATRDSRINRVFVKVKRASI